MALGELIEDEAERHDLSYSEVVANAVAAYYGHPPVAVPKQTNQILLAG